MELGESCTSIVVRYLKQQGLNAMAGWPKEERKRYTKPILVVQVREMQADSAGFQDYLGERYEESTGLWQEVYGKKLHITFGLDLYVTERGDSQSLREAAQQLSQAFVLGAPDGMWVEEIFGGEIRWDESSRCLKLENSLRCGAWLQAVRGVDSKFLDFELRGVCNT